MESTPLIQHEPVMVETVVELLACHAGGIYIDGTVGGGGYAEAILQASAPDGRLLGVDWDEAAVARTRERLRPYGDRVVLERASFAELASVAARHGIRQVDGIVADLGVSSFQLDEPTRGFSFTQDGPLDMRMDQGKPQTAADLVNSLPEKDLADLIFRLGEEKWSRRIARAIVGRRARHPFSRTGELAAVVAEAVPKTRDSRRIHPATRTFQALRLAVNEELETLRDFMPRAFELLKAGGRMCVVAFHSLEDRIVKEKFREWGKSCRCPDSAPRCQCEGRPLARLLTRKPLRPSEIEIAGNPRARSARVRAVERLHEDHEVTSRR